MSRHGLRFGFFQKDRHLELTPELREMRGMYRDDATGEAYARYRVAVVLTIRSHCRKPIELESCYVITGRNEQVQMAAFKNGEGRLEPGGEPKQLALDALNLRECRARRVDLVDSAGRRWSFTRRQLRRVMADYDDHAANAEELNAVESLSHSWEHVDKAQ